MSEDTSMGDSRDINTAILERLEKVVESLQENSIQMGKLLAVHNEKLDKQDRIDAVLFEKVESLHREVNRSTNDIKKGCERDIRMVDERLRMMEKKMWSIFGGLAIISFLVSPVGQRILKPFTESSQLRLTPIAPSAIIGSVEMPLIELS
jgi:hypothetical protein